MGKEDLVDIYSEILLSHRKEWNYAISATWMDLEIIILSEISQTEKDKSHMYHLYMESKIMIKNELIHIMETDSQT